MSVSPTQKDIAKICNVTPATVSRALRYPERHSGKLTQHIREVAASLGYTPEMNGDARRLVQRHRGGSYINHLVLFFLPTNYQYTPYFLDLFAGVIDRLGAEKYGVLTYSCNQNAPLPPSVARGEVDGAIYAAQGESGIRSLMNAPGLAGKPQVVITEACAGLPAIIPDYEGGAEALCQGLLASGWKTILYLHKYPEENPWNGKHLEQLHGIQRAIVAAGKSVEKTLYFCPVSKKMWELCYYMTAHEAHDEVYRFIAEGQETFVQLVGQLSSVAVICPNDNMASVAYALLSRAGYRIPERVAVAGFDDANPFAALLNDRKLTSVRVPLRKCGQEAGSLFLELLAKTPPATLPVRVPLEVMWRNTT